MIQILLVEDSPTDAFLTREAIDPIQFCVTHVERLEHAIAAVADKHFDVVLLDLGLPDSQGLTTLQKLQQEDAVAPVIVLSAKDDESLALDAVSAGAQDYLVKSQIDGDMLERAIRYSIERRKIADSLRQSEARLSEAVRLARLGYWSRDLKTGRLEWSRLLYEIFEIDPATFGNTLESFLACLHPEDDSRVRETVIQAVLKKESFNHTYRITVPGGLKFIHEVGRVYCDKNGLALRVSGTAQDVTEQIKAEEALRLRDRAINAASQGIVIADAKLNDHPLIYVSPGFQKMTGYCEAEVLGRNCRFLQGPKTDPATVAEIRSAIEKGRECAVELINYRKDGTLFWNHFVIAPVRDEVGQLTHFVGVQSDVTERRQLEDQFRQAQKMEAIGRLAGGVAHDFNNLLTVINGYGQIVMEDLPQGQPSKELLSEIVKAGERAAGLTRQLLAFSRQSVLEPQVLIPNDLIRDLDKLLRRLLGEDVDLNTRLGHDVGQVKADPGQMEQAIINLCVNARDAMPTGGKLIIETANVDLTKAGQFADLRPGHYVVISVKDSGTGMTHEVQARVFEPFFTTKEHGKGTGLGLAMVFGFVKQSGGHATVDSEPGIGSTFKLYLPRIDAIPTSGKSNLYQGAMPQGTETIIFVEDEQAVRLLGRHILTSCGYNVLVAGNGREAVQIVEAYSGRIDLLLTDVVMPGGTGGRQLAETLVARYPHLSVLFTSGYTDDAVFRHGVQQSEVQFLQKPFSPVALAQKVRTVLDLRMSRASHDFPSGLGRLG